MSVDSRIVTMKFDNTAFQRGVTTTMDALSKLKAAVSDLGTSKSIGGLDTSKATSGLSQLGSATDGVGSKFSAMSVVAITALATIANSAVQAAGTFIKSFSFGPVMDGLREYELNLQSIQTIQANTDQPLAKIEASLEELNRYSDRTIYNFAEMAKNIGTFTAAGVDLETATSAIKGIANMAALSGSTSQQASTAMYQLSQALAAGRVTLMDWNSVVNAGMGGKKMQEALTRTAVAMGELEQASISYDGKLKTLKVNGDSFRQSLSAIPGQDPWITSEVLANTLASLDGRFSEMALSTEKLADGTLKYKNAAQVAAVMDKERNKLAQEGTVYTNEQWKALKQLSDSSFLAATQVKTLSQVFQVAKETLASGWAATFKNIFGDFGEAKTTFTALSSSINDGINAMALARNKVLSQWNKLGGRQAVIDGLKNAFIALGNVLKPIGEAFREVFPATTAKELVRASEAFRDFTAKLIAGQGTMDNIKSVFKAVFGVIAVGWEILKGVVRSFFSLFGLFSGGAGDLLSLSGSIGDVVSGLTDWILKGDYIAKFFDKTIAGRNAVLKPIIDGIRAIVGALAEFVSMGAEKAFEAISNAMANIAPYLPALRDGLNAAGDAIKNKLLDGLEKLRPVLLGIKDAIADALGSLSGIGGSIGGAAGGLAGLFDIGSSTDAAKSGIDKVKDALSGAGSAAGGAMGGLSDFGSFLASIGGFLKNVASNIWKALGNVWAGVSSAFSNSGSALGDVFGAIGEFFGSVVSFVKETVEGMSLTDILSALNTFFITGLGATIIRLMYRFGSLTKSMENVFNGVSGVIGEVGGSFKAFQLSVKAGALLKIAFAVGILTLSLYLLSKIEGKDIATGLGAITAMLLGLSGAMKLLVMSMPDGDSMKDALQLGGMALVLVALAAAILLLSISVYILGKMDRDTLEQGMIAIGAILAGVVTATAILNKAGGAASIVQAAFAIGILAFALLAFAGALKLYSMLDTGMMAEGGLKIAAMLIGIGIAMNFMPTKGAIGAAFGLLIMAGALVIMAQALQMLAQLDSGDSWQSVITLAGALTVLSIAANSMTGAILGAAAMLIIAAALAILVPSLITLGEMDISTLAIGIAAMAAAFLVLGVVGSVAGIGIAILGAGVLLLGAGLVLAGAALVLFATGLAALAAISSVATAALITNVNMFLDALPKMILKFGNSLLATAQVLQRTGPAFVQAAVAIILAFLAGVRRMAPQVGQTFRVIISEALKTVRALIPEIVQTGFAILRALMDGLRRNISEITNTGVDIMLKFIEGIRKRIDELVEAGADLAEEFISSVANELRDRALGLLVQVGIIGGQIANGMATAIRNAASAVIDAAVNMAQDAISAVKSALDVFSPSRKFMEIGDYVVQGLAKGITDNKDKSTRSAVDMANGALGAVKSTMTNVSKLVADNLDVAPVIAPVLDLTGVAAESRRLTGLLGTKPLTAGFSYNQAASISSSAQASRDANIAAEVSSGSTITLEQNNYSPKALSSAEIYRNTRNQLSLAKEALSAP